MDKKKDEEEELEQPSAPFWMTTYSDMVTLLLTFFVLMISFSNLDEVKFAMAANSLKGALGVMRRYPSVRNNLGIDNNVREQQGVYDSVREIEKKAQELGIENDLNVEFTETGLLIQLGNNILFDSGSDKLKPKAALILDVVGKTIRNNASEVLVSGHTDNVPINTPRFPSNWELSSARSLSVVKYLIDKCQVPPRILGAVGYSEYRPLVPNDTPDHRHKNRRVEFLVTWRKPAI